MINRYQTHVKYSNLFTDVTNVIRKNCLEKREIAGDRGITRGKAGFVRS